MNDRAALGRFVLRRLAWLVPIVLGAVVLTFALAHLAPGTPWDAVQPGQGHGNLSADAIRALDVKYGLDRPLWRQLGLFLAHAARLDFGVSYQFQAQPVRDLLLRSLPGTIALGSVSFVVVAVAGIGLGVLAAQGRGSWVDHAVTGMSSLAASVPSFVVGIFLILGLSVGLNRATGGGFYLPNTGFGFDRRLFMPVLTLSLVPVSFVARLTRTAMLETLGQDHIRAARAKGLSDRAVLLRHVLPNSLVPVVTTLGPLLGFLLTGSVVVETLFQVPGIGGTFVRAVTARDYPVILGATVVYAVVFPVANLLADVVHACVDPRVASAE